MQKTRSTLRLGCPVRFRDQWQGSLSGLQVDGGWTILNIVISRGILRRTQVKLPFSIATAWTHDAIELDCTTSQAFSRDIPPLAVPGAPLSPDVPVSVAGFKLAGALIDIRSRRATHVLLRRGHVFADQRMVPVAQVSFEAGALTIAAHPDNLPVYRPDEELAQAVRDVLTRDPHVTLDDRRGVSVDVADGLVYLSGNVRTPQTESRLVQLASSVPGSAGLHNEIINDRRLELDIGRALDRAGVLRYGRVYARANSGAVTLGGYLGTPGAIEAALRAARAVPGVRSIENRMEIEVVASGASNHAVPAPIAEPAEPVASNQALPPDS